MSQMRRNAISMKRKGVASLEEIFVLAVTLPIAGLIVVFCWNTSTVIFQIIRAVTLSPIL